MNYQTMLAWAHMIAGRGRAAGKTDDEIRAEIFNSALVQFSDDWDDISDAAIRKAKRVVKAVMPGTVKGAAIISAADPVDDDMAV